MALYDAQLWKGKHKTSATAPTYTNTHPKWGTFIHDSQSHTHSQILTAMWKEFGVNILKTILVHHALGTFLRKRKEIAMKVFARLIKKKANVMTLDSKGAKRTRPRGILHNLWELLIRKVLPQVWLLLKYNMNFYI